MSLFRYLKAQIFFKRIYRKLFPVPKSPWTAGHVDDICAVNLVPPEILKTFFAQCIQLLKKVKGAEIGDYLEFGVFNGSSIGSMYIACKNLGMNKIRFFGFDAFEGLPEGSEKEDDGVWKKGFYACSFPQMKICLKQRGVDPDQITWIKGWYNNTLNTATAKKFKMNNIGIVFIDCDTYSSSKSVLDFLAPLITKPAIFCFDDWKLNDLDIKEMGEYRSFNEFLEQNTRLSAKEIPSYNRKSKSFLIRPR